MRLVVSTPSSSGPAIGPADAEVAAADQVRLPETASVTLDLVRAVAAQAVVVGHAVWAVVGWAVGGVAAVVVVAVKMRRGR